MGAQEERFVQVGWHVEHETQEEGCCPCTQGCEPLHQGAVRVQGQASLQDREVLCHEEVEGVAQLSRMTCLLMWSWMHTDLKKPQVGGLTCGFLCCMYRRMPPTGSCQVIRAQK